MQKTFRNFLTFILAACIGLGTLGFFGVRAEKTASAADYYASVTEQSGGALLGQLHDLITSTHTKYTSYDDCKNPSIVTKTDPGTNGQLMEFYARADLSSTWEKGAVGTWNREHVWCQSLSGPDGHELWGESGGGADLHHIRPTEARVNSARGNNKYAEFSGGSTVWYRDASNKQIAIAGYTSGGKFMPKDEVKGDVARIVMYVYTHYNTYGNVNGKTNGKGNSSYFGTLQFTYVVSASSETDAIGMLLDWNRSDPVDESERTRNDAAYAIQGNRNPYIDHPEYADAIWGDGSTTEELTSLSLSPASLTLTVGQSQRLSAIPTPSNASRSATWSTSNAAVATVEGGLVTAKNEGTATITATSAVNPAIKATALVNVTQAGTAEGAFTITAASFAATSGYSFQTWEAGGTQGIAYIYGSNTESMQFNKNKPSYYLACTSAVLGPIRSVTVKSTEGTADREWKLLTSSSPYGQVNGKPTEGADQGTKTVTSEGTTWTVSGNDTYFALTYEFADDGSLGAAAYLDSIVVEYGAGGGGDVGGDVGGGTDGKVKAFTDAVAAIVKEGTPQARLASLNTAIAAYGALTESERALADEAVDALNEAIYAYNEWIGSYNRAADDAGKAALGGIDL